MDEIECPQCGHSGDQSEFSIQDEALDACFDGYECPECHGIFESDE